MGEGSERAWRLGWATDSPHNPTWGPRVTGVSVHDGVRGHWALQGRQACGWEAGAPGKGRVILTHFLHRHILDQPPV